MSKEWGPVQLSVVLPMFALVTLFFILAISVYQPVLALNTYSIDFERGSTQHLSITDASQSNLDLSGDFTIEAWVKVESNPGTNEEYAIVGKYNNNGVDQRAYLFNYQHNVSAGTYQLRSLISSDGTGGNTTFMTANQTLTPGTWYHVAFSYTASSGSGTFYVNGSSVGTGSSGPSSIHNSSGEFQIGSFQTGGTDAHFDGLVDEVRIWNIARTGTEINDDKSRELNGNETGLVGYWKLNNSLEDSTVSNNDLSNNGSAVHSADTPFSGFTEVLKVRKSADESVTSSTVLQNDDDLKLSLSANKTYIIDGVLFASSTSATPDVLIGFFGQSGVNLKIGYTNEQNEMVLGSGAQSSRIVLPANTPTSIHIHGTIVTGSTAGDLQLKWAQATSNGAATVMGQGSYLRAEEI